MVAAFAEAGSFEPAADMGLCQGVREFFDADDKDRLDGVNVPHNLRKSVAVSGGGLVNVNNFTHFWPFNGIVSQRAR